MNNQGESSGCTIWLIIFIPVAIIMGLTKGCTNLLLDNDFGKGQSPSFALAILLLIVIVVIAVIKKGK